MKLTRPGTRRLGQWVARARGPRKCCSRSRPSGLDDAFVKSNQKSGESSRLPHSNREFCYMFDAICLMLYVLPIIQFQNVFKCCLDMSEMHFNYVMQYSISLITLFIVSRKCTCSLISYRHDQ